MNSINQVVDAAASSDHQPADTRQPTLTPQDSQGQPDHGLPYMPPQHSGRDVFERLDLIHQEFERCKKLELRPPAWGNPKLDGHNPTGLKDYQKSAQVGEAGGQGHEEVGWPSRWFS